MVNIQYSMLKFWSHTPLLIPLNQFITFAPILKNCKLEAPNRLYALFLLGLRKFFVNGTKRQKDIDCG
jgi:hypothetical protein